MIVMPTQRRRIRKIERAGGQVLKPVRPNAGIEAAYRCKLRDLVDEMHNSILYWLKAAYRANEPEVVDLGQDELPANALKRAIAQLARRWLRKFNDAAPELAAYFGKAINQRSTKDLQGILRRSGIMIDFKMTAAQRDVLNATIAQNVGLIKSIPQQYLVNVQGMVMRSIQSGRDLSTLTADIEKQYGVTRRRAALIARDQNNKATTSMVHARQRELGLSKGIWRHSAAGKQPRPTHVAMDGKEYDLSMGMWDSAVKKWVLPGELINCRCTGAPIIEGFTP